MAFVPLRLIRLSVGSVGCGYVHRTEPMYIGNGCRNLGCFRDIDALDRRNFADPSRMIAEVRVEGAKLGCTVLGIVVGE